MLRNAVLGLAGGAAILAGGVLVWELAGGKTSRGAPPAAVVAPAKSEAPGGTRGQRSVTARLSQDRFYPWPGKPEVIGPPQGSPGRTVTRQSTKTSDLLPKPTDQRSGRAEPAPASPEDLKTESLRTGDELSLEGARAVLLDEQKGSSLKLAIIDKLRTQNPQDAIPMLVEFLGQAPSASSAYTKPTAVKVLVDFKDPAADEALCTLSRTSPDERVRLTIAAFKAKEASR
jgi:hypothetical protein